MSVALRYATWHILGRGDHFGKHVATKKTGLHMQKTGLASLAVFCYEPLAEKVIITTAESITKLRLAPAEAVP